MMFSYSAINPEDGANINGPAQGIQKQLKVGNVNNAETEDQGPGGTQVPGGQGATKGLGPAKGVGVTVPRRFRGERVQV